MTVDTPDHNKPVFEGVFQFPHPLFRAPTEPVDREFTDQEKWDLILAECISPFDDELLAEHLAKAPDPNSPNVIQLQSYLKLRHDAKLLSPGTP
jgi:hypothetical protein